MQDARLENRGQPAVPVSKKQEVLRTSNFFPKSLQSAHDFRIWLFLDAGTKKELCLFKYARFAKDLFCKKTSFLP